MIWQSMLVTKKSYTCFGIGKLPTQAELDDFQSKLVANMSIPAPVMEQMKLYPKNMNTMAALRTAVSSLALYDEEAEI